MATKTNTERAVTNCTITAVVSAIKNRAPLADFDEYANADHAAEAVVGDRL